MTLNLIRGDEVPSQAWRNGGGTTRELLCWPSTIDCQLRVSVADITRDGPFSPFPGLTRWFAVMQGTGVLLHLDGQDRRVRAGDAPLCFDGAAAPGCRLLDGPTRDLNLMLRGGRGLLHAATRNQPWETGGFRVNGLFTAGPGRWVGDGDERHLAPHNLLWDDGAPATAWHFEPHTPDTPAWWFGFTPDPPP